MTDTGEQGELNVPVGERDHIQGSLRAPVALVMYGDYECPDTYKAYQVIKRIQEHSGDTLCYVFRNFPLTDIHPHAEHAAEAAEAAAAQDRFWPMYDYLFEHQQSLGDQSLKRYASHLGLDMDRFNRDFAEHRYQGRVEQDIAGGKQSGVSGTPALFINGKRFHGSTYYRMLLEAIESAR